MHIWISDNEAGDVISVGFRLGETIIEPGCATALPNGYQGDCRRWYALKCIVDKDLGFQECKDLWVVSPRVYCSSRSSGPELMLALTLSLWFSRY